MTPRVDVREGVLGMRWWSLVLRGAAAIAFGALALSVPRAALPIVTVVWGSFAFGDAITSAVLAACAAGDRLRWGWLAFETIGSGATGVLAFFAHAVTPAMLVAAVALWAVMTSFSEVVGAVRVRRLMRGERVLAMLGIVAAALAAVLLATAGPGFLARPALINAYAVGGGALLIALGIGVLRWSRPEPQPRARTSGGAAR